MNSDEEYLDNLLKDMMNSDTGNGEEGEAAGEPIVLDASDAIVEEPIDDMGFFQNMDEMNEEGGDGSAEEPPDIDFDSIADSQGTGRMMSPEEIDAMFAAADDAAQDYEGGSLEDNAETEAESVGEESYDPDSDLADLEELLKSFQGDEDDDSLESGQPEKAPEDDLDALMQGIEPDGTFDSDLDELNGFLDHSEESVKDDEMLAFLEGMSGEQEEYSGAEEDNFDVFGMNDDTEVPIDIPAGEEIAVSDAAAGDGAELPVEDEAVPAKKKRVKKERRKKGNSAENGENIPIENGDMIQMPEKEKKASKKRGLFSRMMAFLTETDEDAADEQVIAIPDDLGSGEIELPLGEPSDENMSLLAEMALEDKSDNGNGGKKKKVKNKKDKTAKKEKKGKRNKKGAKGEETAADAEAEEDEDEASPKAGKGKKEKKKKPPKVKKTTAASEDRQGKPGKRLSRKKVVVTFLFTLTIGAVILLLCFFIPRIEELRQARDAYYSEDYQTVHDLLYGRKLNESDSIIYERADLILRMQRKLDAYRNYSAMQMGINALDALLQGVDGYKEYEEAAQQLNISQKTDGIYGQILEELSGQYGLTQQDALEILAYEDKLTYTRRLQSIVNGTPFVVPGMETEQNIADILPEEAQDILGAGEQPQMRDNAPEISAAPGADTSPGEPVIREGTEEDVSVVGTNLAAPTQDGAESGLDSGEIGTAPDTGAEQEEGQRLQGVSQPIDVQINQN